jgi:Tol biopolymer transport system component
VYFSEFDPNSGEPVLKQVSIKGGDGSPIPTTLESVLPLDISRDRSELLVAAGGRAALNKSLWVLPLPSGSARRIGDVLIDGGEARWSPDGKLIVFEKGSDIWVANADGSNPVRLLTVQGRPRFISFSPDQSRIRFAVVNDQDNTRALWEMGADGSHPHPLLPGWHNPPREWNGVWTPDGQYYVFESIAAGTTSTNIFALPYSTGSFI